MIISMVTAEAVHAGFYSHSHSGVLRCYYIRTSLYLPYQGFFWQSYSSVSDLGAGVGLKSWPIQFHTVLFFLKNTYSVVGWFILGPMQISAVIFIPPPTGSNLRGRNSKNEIVLGYYIEFIRLIKCKLMKPRSRHIWKYRKL